MQVLCPNADWHHCKHKGRHWEAAHTIATQQMLTMFDHKLNVEFVSYASTVSQNCSDIRHLLQDPWFPPHFPVREGKDKVQGVIQSMVVIYPFDPSFLRA